MITDPIEAIVAEALSKAGIRYLHENDRKGDLALDFYLPELDTYIEVKQFHSDRIARQMAQAPNVIAIQGRDAAKAFAAMITKIPLQTTELVT